MIYTFSGGLLVSLLLLMVLVALPVKLAAMMASARRTGLLWCCAAVAVGLWVGYLVSFLIGGYIGGPLAGFIGFVLGMRLMLGTSFAAALGLSIIAFALSIVGFMLLMHFGIIVGVASSSGGIAT